jgi:hypothetical protein
MTDLDDRYDQLCTECEMGRYHETSIHDDWDGVLHCTNKECNYEVRRYKSMDNFEPEPDRVVKLSPTDEQPVVPTDEELWEAWGCFEHEPFSKGDTIMQLREFLARWGQP